MEVHTQRPCHPAVVSKDMMLIRDFGNNLANQLQIVEEWSWSHRKPGHSQIFRRERERSHAATCRASLSQPSLYLYLVHQQFCTQLSCSSRSLSWRWATGDGALWTLYPTSSNSSPKLRSAQVKRKRNTRVNLPVKLQNNAILSDSDDAHNHACIILNANVVPLSNKQAFVRKAVNIKICQLQLLTHFVGRQ